MTVSETTRTRVRAAAGERCGYCRVPARHVYAQMQIDHILPQAKGGRDDESNLWLSCPRCNGFKRDQTHGLDPATGRRFRLFNPRRQVWERHFRMNDDGTMVGRTACGRATVEALHMNYAPSVIIRRYLLRAGWHPSP